MRPTRTCGAWLTGWDSMLSDSFIEHIGTVRRYSVRTREIYRGVLADFISYSCDSPVGDDDILRAVNPTAIRNYEVHLLHDLGESPVTVNLHLSVISSFARYLIKRDLLSSNPVRLVPRPKTDKRLPEVYREESLEEYFRASAWYDEAPVTADMQSYLKRLSRLIISLLYNTGMRRSELIGLTRGGVDFGRHVIRVRGKGDKEREIPVLPELCDQISRYMEAAELATGCDTSPAAPLLVTGKGRPLYPVFVDRTVKGQLGMVHDITGRKSPHIFRHTIATELLDKGADLYSIKEMLGHSSLGTTQIYTHNSIERLRREYDQAHPRTKKK